MSKKDETIVAESVVVIKKLLQINVKKKNWLFYLINFPVFSHHNIVILLNILFEWLIK
jgi:hypothetical protein